jgi:2-polyprenyl-6-methoxyphenol hydroxylase-like FAD-dependent oxidoreductase
VTRVVEKRPAPARQSKALAVNPRTLEILEETGITEQMLARGLRVRGALLYRGEKTVAAVEFDGLHPKYPFMLALSQATSERLLAAALEAAGGRVEREVKLVACRNAGGHVEATLAPSASDGAGAGDAGESVECPWVLAADGAHSTAREQLGIAFEGTALSHPWHLADAPLRTGLAADHAHVFFGDGGAFGFMLRVVDDLAAEDPAAPALWRVMSNRPDPLAHLVRAEPAGEPAWTSTFRIDHRTAATLGAGRVYLAGDAAHVHSPFGARGMNLGLEDAWVFARLAAADRLGDYNRLRHPVDRRVVRVVEFLTRTVSAESTLRRLARTYLFPTALRVPSLRARMRATLTGLDHDLPDVGAP